MQALGVKPKRKNAPCEPPPIAVSAIAHEYRHVRACDSRVWRGHSTLAVQFTGRNSFFKFPSVLPRHISNATHDA